MKVGAVNSAAGVVNQDQAFAAVDAGAIDKQEAAEKTEEAGKVEKAVQLLNRNAEAANRETRFALNKDIHRIYVEVVDKDTNQVVASFPPKQILQMAEALEQQAKLALEKDGKEVK